MFNTSLLVSCFVILAFAWAQESTNGPDIVTGTRDRQIGNVSYFGLLLHGNGSSKSSDTVLGSQTIKTVGRYVTFGRVNKVQIVLPPWYKHLNGIPRDLTELTDGPNANANMMSLKRHQQIQEKITSLNLSCEQIKNSLNQLLTTKFISTAVEIIRQVIGIQLNLINQQSLLDNFNNVYLNHQTKDDFDENLHIEQLNIEQLMTESLSLIRSQNEITTEYYSL